jgi:MFS family permease
MPPTFLGVTARSHSVIGSPGHGMPSLAWLVLMAFLLSATSSAVPPLLPDMLDRYGLEASEVKRHLAFLAGTYSAAVLVAAPIFGAVSDCHGRTRIILLSATLYAFALSAMVTDPAPGGLYVFRAVAGACVGAFLPVAMAHVADHSTTTQRTLRFAGLTTATMAGALMGPYLSGLNMGTLAHVPFLSAVSFRGYQMTAWAGALFIGVTSLGIRRSLHRAANPAIVAMSVMNAPKGLTPLYLWFGMSALLMFAVGAFDTGLSTTAANNSGFDSEALAMMYAECALVMLIMQMCLFFERFRNFANRYLLLPTATVTAAAVVFSPVVRTHGGLLWLTAVIAGSAGLVAPLISYRISNQAYAHQGRKFGLQSASANLGLALGGSSIGWLGPIHPFLPFWLAGGVLMLGVAWTVRSLAQEPLG